MVDAINSARPPESTGGALESGDLSWMDIFTGVLLEPLATFRAVAVRNENELNGVGGAVGAIALAFALDATRSLKPDQYALALVTVPLSIITGLTMWLCLTALIWAIASAFNAPQARLRASIVCFGWSFLPWMFMGPLWLYRETFGSAFILVSQIPFIWVFLLQLAALKENFKLNSWQVFALIFIAPLAYNIFTAMQVGQSIYAAMSAVF